MKEEADKREHSTKPEVDDLTDYQALNSLGGAGVAGEAKETPPSGGPQESAAVSGEGDAPAEVQYSGDYNDGADFNTIDNEAQTNN